jgi:von Willebrand factor type C domain
VFVHHVRKRYVEKIQLFKSIELAIPISQDNAVINLIALRVGEIEGRHRTEKNDKILFCFLFFSSKSLDSNQCHHEKKIYQENETWSIDHCTTCTCRAGRMDCATIQCPIYTHCGYMYKPENECCPKCGGKDF